MGIICLALINCVSQCEYVAVYVLFSFTAFVVLVYDISFLFNEYEFSFINLILYE